MKDLNVYVVCCSFRISKLHMFLLISAVIHESLSYVLNCKKPSCKNTGYLLKTVQVRRGYSDYLYFTDFSLCHKKFVEASIKK